MCYDDELRSYDVLEAFTVKHESWSAMDVEGNWMVLYIYGL
jgi:hypothetical protein